jgi:transketolase
MMYNYVPMSGHPGGSISSGRIVSALLFDILDYDFSDPSRLDADILSYAAGHKAMGLYAMWALRDEAVRLKAPELVPQDQKLRLRLEDLLGFRRNPSTTTPLFLLLNVKALDGHPTPATPFVRLATGASGVGVASSIGLAIAARDYFDGDLPWVHIIEGEGGLTPGRAFEALAAAGTACLSNVVLHLDWNQASIDTNRVCREDDQPGDYVQWNPSELFHLHDWNVIYVPDGHDFQQIVAAQRLALTVATGQPTAIIYRTVKGWQYGIEGRGSHGAGHKLCSEGFYEALSELSRKAGVTLPSCEAGNRRCQAGPDGPAIMEECFWEALGVVRREMKEYHAPLAYFSSRVGCARDRLELRGRKPRPDRPDAGMVYRTAEEGIRSVPPELEIEPGTVTTLRGELGRALKYYNRISGGAFFAAAADLLGSTNLNLLGDGFPSGYWNAKSNRGSRLLSTGGICEDAMTGILSGLTSFGYHIGVGSSYAAFLAPLGHIAARLHAIGGQALKEFTGESYRPIILACAHAGLKTGEDGPTHADPQPLQLLQENFPPGTAITLTPWDPCEIWPLLSAALARRPAIIAPFVTRPNEIVVDRKKLGLAPVEETVKGVYLLWKPRGEGIGTVVLQESAVTYAFIRDALPRLQSDGLELWVYYISSAELFSLLSAEEQKAIFPEERAQEAIGVTGFTLPTLYRWVRSDRGRSASLHPFRDGHFLGSGQGHMVLREAGLDGESQYRAIKDYLTCRPNGDMGKSDNAAK